MKKDFAFWTLISMAVLFMIGIILIFASVSAGMDAGSAAMQRNGGIMDSGAYERIINSTIFNFRAVGIILSVLSGIGALVSGYLAYQEIEHK
jgi:hypothetical protein